MTCFGGGEQIGRRGGGRVVAIRLERGARRKALVGGGMTHLQNTEVTVGGWSGLKAYWNWPAGPVGSTRWGGYVRTGLD